MNTNSNKRLIIKKLIQDAKVVCCVKDCGCTDKELLTFHHRDGEKKFFDIADGPRHSIGAVKREIKKCDVMCRPCHDSLHGMVSRQPGDIKIRTRKRVSGAQRRKRRKERARENV